MAHYHMATKHGHQTGFYRDRRRIEDAVRVVNETIPGNTLVVCSLPWCEAEYVAQTAEIDLMVKETTGMNHDEYEAFCKKEFGLD